VEVVALPPLPLPVVPLPLRRRLRRRRRRPRRSPTTTWYVFASWCQNVKLTKQGFGLFD
jgi:hypothetical protein